MCWFDAHKILPDGSQSDGTVPWAFKSKRPSKNSKRYNCYAKDSTGRVFPAIYIESYGFVNNPPITLYRHEVFEWSLDDSSAIVMAKSRGK